MDDFVILTDSCCDMTARMAADLELEVLPLSLNMEDRVYHNYLDGREIGFQDFYARLRAGALATTSAISVGDLKCCRSLSIRRWTPNGRNTWICMR